MELLFGENLFFFSKNKYVSENASSSAKTKYSTLVV